MNIFQSTPPLPLLLPVSVLHSLSIKQFDFPEIVALNQYILIQPLPESHHLLPSALMIFKENESLSHHPEIASLFFYLQDHFLNIYGTQSLPEIDETKLTPKQTDNITIENLYRTDLISGYQKILQNWQHLSADEQYQYFLFAWVSFDFALMELLNRHFLPDLKAIFKMNDIQHDIILNDSFELFLNNCQIINDIEQEIGFDNQQVHTFLHYFKKQNWLVDYFQQHLEPENRKLFSHL